MKRFNIRHLASAVRWWLSYVSGVGREYILNESSIKIPASEYLETCNKVNLDLEHGHPVFKQRSIDLFFRDLSVPIDVVIEFKFVQEDSTRVLSERQRVFNDLMRLHFFVVNGHGNGYFLICGNEFYFKASFQTLKLDIDIPPLVVGNPPTVVSILDYYSEWFSFTDYTNPKIVNLAAPTLGYANIYTGFVEEYSKSYLTRMGTALVLPPSIKTQLIYLSPDLMETNVPTPNKIGIWQVVP